MENIKENFEVMYGTIGNLKKFFTDSGNDPKF